MEVRIHKKLSDGEKYGKKIYKILKYLPKKYSNFLVDVFRNNCLSIGYAMRWAAYKRLCRRIGENVGFEPCTFVYNPEGLSVGDNVIIHALSHINCENTTVTISDNVAIGPRCLISTTKHNFIKYDKQTGRRKQGITYTPVFIDKNVWIGGSCKILGGSTIGEGSVIGAASLVNSEIPPFHVCVGIPAKPIKKLEVIYE